MEGLKIIEVRWELMCLSKQELGEEPIYWLLDRLAELTKKEISFEIIKNEIGNPYDVILKGKLGVIKRFLIKEKYITEEDFNNGYITIIEC